MAILDLTSLNSVDLRRDPFDYLVVSRLLPPGSRDEITADFPKMELPGLFPPSELSYGPRFAALLAEIDGPALEEALSEKFGIALSGLPTLVTIRGRCRRRDGQIHTDSTWKVVSALIYLNEPWGHEGGRLRLLRSANLDDKIVEISPEWGSFVAFRRCDRSYHGHEPYEGQRRVIQINWCTSQDEIDREVARHRRTAWLKRTLSFGRLHH